MIDERIPIILFIVPHFCYRFLSEEVKMGCINSKEKDSNNSGLKESLVDNEVENPASVGTKLEKASSVENTPLIDEEKEVVEEGEGKDEDEDEDEEIVDPTAADIKLCSGPAVPRSSSSSSSSSSTRYILGIISIF